MQFRHKMTIVIVLLIGFNTLLSACTGDITINLECQIPEPDPIHIVDPALVGNITTTVGEVYWQITLNVICDKIVIEKEIVIIQHEVIGGVKQNFSRLVRQVTRLHPSPSNDCTITKGITVLANQINFDGAGYIQCTDPDLLHALQTIEQTGQTLYDPSYALPDLISVDCNWREEEEGSLDCPFIGNTFYVEVDLNVDNEANQTTHPLFVYQQGQTRFVDFGIQTNNNREFLSLNIDNMPPNDDDTLLSPQDILVREWRRFRVRKIEQEFEFLSDAVSLGFRGAQLPQYDFGTQANTFYIGHNPETAVTFKGTLRHFEFDPDDSCADCPR